MIFRASLVAQMVKCLPAMWETWIQSPGWEDPLEKEIATHSSTLTWKIPWMEEPGRLQSMGSQWVGHNCATLLTGMIFSAWLKHDDKNFLGISSCDTLSSPMRQALLVLTNENIWSSESRSWIPNYQESAGIIRKMREQVSQVRNPDVSAMHGGIKKWLITNSVSRKVGQDKT